MVEPQHPTQLDISRCVALVHGQFLQLLRILSSMCLLGLVNVYHNILTA